MKTVCFTGHRPPKVGGYNEDNVTARWVKQQLAIAIDNAIKDGYRRFIFGGALGVDTWAGEIVADLNESYDVHNDIKLYLELYSPFEGQEGNWPEESKIRYYNLMARCDNIVTVCEPGYKAWKMLVRDKAMVEASDLVICVWNGDTVRSGTGHTVAYAEKKGKPIVRINPKDAI